MAIQTINLTVPGGDTPRSANTKINANFSNTTHAASRLLGAERGKVALAEQIRAVTNTLLDNALNSMTITDCNDLPPGTKYQVLGDTPNLPPREYGTHSWTIETFKNSSVTVQIATSYSPTVAAQVIRVATDTSNWGPWTPMCANPATYSTTTADGANVVVDSTGNLMRSTSSERYKDILSPLELDDARYADAMALKPIIYRSTADADNPAYHYYSFSAEELGAVDPAFTLWRDTETVTDEDGNVTEQPLAERQAEGININALLAMSHAIAIKQDKLIKGLQEQVIEQKEAIAALQQTNP